jgi:hypothetical protein
VDNDKGMEIFMDEGEKKRMKELAHKKGEGLHKFEDKQKSEREERKIKNQTN